MPLVGFEPTVSAGERLETYDINRETTGKTGHCKWEVLRDSFIALPKSLL
jgi:hypothetical protein